MSEAVSSGAKESASSLPATVFMMLGGASNIVKEAPGYGRPGELELLF